MSEWDRLLAGRIQNIKSRMYEEDNKMVPWTPGRCAGYVGRRDWHLLNFRRCKRKAWYGLGNLFCDQHAGHMIRFVPPPTAQAQEPGDYQ